MRDIYIVGRPMKANRLRLRLHWYCSRRALCQGVLRRIGAHRYGGGGHTSTGCCRSGGEATPDGAVAARGRWVWALLLLVLVVLVRGIGFQFSD